MGLSARISAGRLGRRIRPLFSGPRVAALRSLFGIPLVAGLLPAAAGTAAVLIVRPSVNADLFWCTIGLAGLAGAYALHSAYRAALARLRCEGLDSECRDLAQKCSLYLARARSAEGNVESLSLIREIHRTGNVTARAERFRGILGVVAQTADAVAAELFTPEGRDALPSISAALRLLADGELFVYFRRPLAAGRVDTSQISCRKVTENACGDRSLLHGEVCVDKDPVGFAELALTGRARPRRGGPTARQLLEAQVRSLNLEPAGADQALEHRQVFRIHDQAGAALTVSYPLMAEGVITGAMRLLLPAETLARRELDEIEELLQETAEHVGLVVKKDEDVQQAKRDGLTGLLLRKEMQRDLREEFGRALNSGGRFGVLMMDIDHFKAVNDTHGHRTGDAVLKAVAACVGTQVRSCDRAYRYGGEEMAVLLPGADEAAAGRTAERLRRAVAALELTSDAGAPVPVTISIGLSDMIASGPVTDAEEMVSRADQALYHSKESGRNCTSVWRPKGPVALPRGRTARRVRSTGRNRSQTRPASTRS